MRVHDPQRSEGPHLGVSAVLSEGIGTIGQSLAPGNRHPGTNESHLLRVIVRSRDRMRRAVQEICLVL